MYLDFFKLQQLPFRLTADPRFYYRGVEHVRAQESLRRGLEEGGCVWVTGEAGVGKTILVQDLLGLLPSDWLVIQIRQPEISVDEFYQSISAQFEEAGFGTIGGGAGSPGGGGAVQFDAHAAQAAGRSIVVALDNGELMPEELLDETLRLPRREGEAGPGVKVIVAARSSKETLRQSRFQGLAGRVRSIITLLPLNPQETRRYIEHRLRVAGRTAGPLFQDEAFDEIQRYTGGMPRLVNMLADAALMAAFNHSHDTVTAAEIRSAVNQLQWVEFDAHPVRSDPHSGASDDTLLGHIRFEYENAVVAELDLPLGKLSVGRASNNDVRVDSRFVSRHHCQIITTSQYSVIEDLQSQNGIIVARRRVSVHRLQHGDRIGIGTHSFVYTRVTRFEPRGTSSLPLSLSAGSHDADTAQTSMISALPTVNDPDPKAS